MNLIEKLTARPQRRSDMAAHGITWRNSICNHRKARLSGCDELGACIPSSLPHQCGRNAGPFLSRRAFWKDRLV